VALALAPDHSHNHSHNPTTTLHINHHHLHYTASSRWDCFGALRPCVAPTVPASPTATTTTTTTHHTHPLLCTAWPLLRSASISCTGPHTPPHNTP
jgi:hypothetical protein